MVRACRRSTGMRRSLARTGPTTDAGVREVGPCGRNALDSWCTAGTLVGVNIGTHSRRLTASVSYKIWRRARHVRVSICAVRDSSDVQAVVDGGAAAVGV